MAPTKDCYTIRGQLKLEIKSAPFLRFTIIARQNNGAVIQIGDNFTYKSSHFTAIFGRAALQNLGKDILNIGISDGFRKAGEPVILTPTISISVETI
jgi:hypothetical protein